MGTAGIGLAGVGAFSGTAVAWEKFGVDFRGCSEVWLIIDEEDLDYKKYDRDEPLFVKVVVERDGDVECETVEFTEETTTTIPGQYGDYPLVKFDGGDKILAVIKYNHNDYANCYIENENRCAQTPNVPDWRDADCFEDLFDYDPERFNQPCADRGKLSFTDDDSPGGPPHDGDRPPHEENGRNNGNSGRNQARKVPGLGKVRNRSH